MRQSIQEILPAGKVTASGSGTQVDVRDLEGFIALALSASATAGADNTLDVAIEHSPDGVTWEAVPGISFDQVTNAAASFQEVNVNVDGLYRYLRASDTLAGTAPEVSRALLFVGQPKY
jgi:hypothetical protein